MTARHGRGSPAIQPSTIGIGPHRFTPADARATLRHAEDLFDLLVDGLPTATAALAGPFRTAALAVVDRPLDDALATYWSQLRAAGDALRAAGAYGGPVRGTVVRLGTSAGGVPKVAVERVDVGYDGVVGDVQATRRHHGRPWQALCLWSAEVIDDLTRLGHPIGYGSAGENVTISGIDWARVRPGAVLDIGTVRCDAVAFALPCRQNARWFNGGKIGLMHHRTGPVSRVYALVTTPGAIATGDDVLVMPGSTC
jgi:MOSC domain-containing protein YiiM